MASHRVRLVALLFALSPVFAQPTLADPVATCGAPGPSASASAAASAGAHVISSVPAYSWYHGCGPTAAASVLGYWDLAGYRNLFTASAPDIFSTPSVQDQISSPAHNAKYDPSPDAPGPAPASTSIADWFQTSVDPLAFGWSFLSFAQDAFEGYAAYRGYQFEAQTRAIAALSDGFSFSWDDAVREIDGGRPFLSLVDTDGNGATDHFVPVLGYDDRGPLGRFYGFYTTWDESETISWEPFRPLGNPWGMGYATFVRPLSTPSPVPEPGTWMLVATGAVAARRRLLRAWGHRTGAWITRMAARSGM